MCEEEDPYVTYNPPGMCNQCFSSVETPNKSTCKHVLCDTCDLNFRTKFPGHECGLCQSRDSDEEDPPYLKPIPATRNLMRRRSSLTDLRSCPSCKTPGIGLMTSHCLDCKMDICATCTDNHSKMAILQHHRVVPSEMANVPVPPEKVFYCLEHVDQIATGVCTTCVFSWVCDLCIEGLHAGHVVQMKDGSPPLPRSPNRKNSLNFKDLLAEIVKLRSSVAEKRAILVSSIESADKEIQDNTKLCITEMLTQAEQMKKDIDKQVMDQTQLLSARQQKLLTRCSRRKNYIQQRTNTMEYDLEKIRQEAERYLNDFNNSSNSGYTRMQQNDDLFKKRQNLQKTLESFSKRLKELTFEYLRPDPGPNRGLGKIEPLRRLCKISEMSIQRFVKETEYVVTSIRSDNERNVLFTSCKEATKAAVDLVDLNGNAIHTRKLQDNGQNPEVTPAFGAMMNSDIAILCWESSVFQMKIANRADQVLNFSVKNQLVHGAKISCLTVDRRKQRLAFGNDRDRTINFLNFDMGYEASIIVKEEGEPLSSISFHGDYIVASDGQQMAVLVDLNGTTISRFLPPDDLYDLKPLTVDSCNGLAYILWSKEEGDYRKAFIQCYSLFPQTVGKRLGQPLPVPDDCKFIATVKMERDDDRLVVSNETGHMTIYCIQVEETITQLEGAMQLASDDGEM